MQLWNQLLFAKSKENAIIPTKNTEDAGYDIYACFDEDFIEIEPHQTKMIPTGIHSACSEDYYIQLKERGSTGTKGIAQRCGVIDSGYRNEWFIPITNTTNKVLIICKDVESTKELALLEYGNEISELGISIDDVAILYPYNKAICQAVVLPVPTMKVKEVSLDELNSIKSIRGTGALGSSGK